MVGNCALCGNHGTLKLSHLVPEFVERRLKADAGTPFFRSTNANRRVQSGAKVRLLCGRCEDIFSDYEAEFAESYYHPTRDGAFIEIPCTDGIVRFLASIAWRNLVAKLRAGPAGENDLREADWKAIEATEQQLRGYLSGMRDHPTNVEHHIVAHGANAETDHDGVNTYVNMVISMGVPATDDAIYSLVQIPGVSLVGLINPVEDCRRKWGNGTHAVSGGLIRNHHQTVDDGSFGYFIVEGAKKMRAQNSTLSDRQKTLIEREAAENPIVRDPTSVITRAWLQDVLNRRR